MFYKGETWLEVKPPGEGLKISQVAVGSHSVWYAFFLRIMLVY